MSDYIFCARKKNNPRINVRVCQTKCIFRDSCKEFLAYKEKVGDKAPLFNPGLIVPPLLNPIISKT